MGLEKVGSILFDTVNSNVTEEPLKKTFFSQDKGTAIIRFKLTESGMDFNLSTLTNATASVAIKTNDGSLFDGAATIDDAEAGLVSYIIRDEILLHEGPAKGELFIDSDGKRIAVIQFTFNIKLSLIDQHNGDVPVVIESIETIVRQIINENPDKFKGDSLTFEELTEEQKAEIRGATLNLDNFVKASDLTSISNLKNLLGTIGGFHSDTNNDGLADGWTKGGTGTFTGISWSDGKQINAVNYNTNPVYFQSPIVTTPKDAYVLVAMDMTSTNTTDRQLREYLLVNNSGGSFQFNYKNNDNLAYTSFKMPTVSTGFSIVMVKYDDAVNTYDNVRVYTLSQAEYDALQSMTPAQIKQKYPYTESHTHLTSEITDLQAKLDAKANTSHTHSTSQVTGLDTALSNKADKTHNHAISEVTGLQTALDGKATAGHNHDLTYSKIGDSYTKTESDNKYALKGAVSGGGTVAANFSMKDVADFGLIGDGVTNNYAAIKAWRDHANKYPGTIYWVNPVYKATDGTEKPAVYRSTEYKVITNVDGNVAAGAVDDIIWNTKNMTVFFNGAKFISSPLNGFTKTPTIETVGSWYVKEEQITLFNLDQCEFITFYGLHIDGEIEKIKWSSGVVINDGVNPRYNSKQIAEGRGHGVIIGGGRHIKMSHCKFNKFSVDGLVIGFARDWANYKMINAEYVTLDSCDFHGNGRLGASGLGAFGIQVINCSFKDTGKVIFNAPAAGFDFEPHGSPLGADNKWHESIAPQGAESSKWRADKWNGNFKMVGGEIAGNRGGALAVTSTMLTRNVIFENVSIKADLAFPAPYYIITAAAQDVKFINCDIDGTLANGEMSTVFPFGYGDLISMPTGVIVANYANVKTSFINGQYKNLDFWTNDDNGATVRNDVPAGEWGMHETEFHQVAGINVRFRYNHSRKVTMRDCQWFYTTDKAIDYFNLWNAVIDNVTIINKKASTMALGFGTGENSSQIRNLQLTSGKFTFVGDAPYLTKSKPKQGIDVYDRNSELDYLKSLIGTGSTTPPADTTAPNAPTVNAVYTNSTTISGTAEANSTITLSGGFTGTTTTNSSGSWTIVASNLTAGQVITVKAKDAAGNVSAGTNVTIQSVPVSDTTPPNAPTVNTITTADTSVTGTAEANSTVIATFNGGTTAQATANSSTGAFTIAKPSGVTLTAGQTVSVVAKDASGNTSTATVKTIQAVTTTSTNLLGAMTNTAAVTEGWSYRKNLNNVISLNWNNGHGGINGTAGWDLSTKDQIKFTNLAYDGTTTGTTNSRAIYFKFENLKPSTVHTIGFDLTYSDQDDLTMFGGVQFGANSTSRRVTMSFKTDSSGAYGYRFDPATPYGTKADGSALSIPADVAFINKEALKINKTLTLAKIMLNEGSTAQPYTASV